MGSGHWEDRPGPLFGTPAVKAVPAPPSVQAPTGAARAAALIPTPQGEAAGTSSEAALVQAAGAAEAAPAAALTHRFLASRDSRGEAVPVGNYVTAEWEIT